MTPLDSSQERAELLQKVLANSKARARQLEIAHEAAIQRENCSLHLAYVLLGLRAELGLGFQELATELGRVVDGTTLHKIAYRQRGLRLRTYKILAERINELREKNDLDAINFDQWKEYR